MRLPITGTRLHDCCDKIKALISIGKCGDALFRWRELSAIAGVQQVHHTVFSHILKACLGLPCRFGKSVHAFVIKREYQAFTSVSNSLIDFYAKSENLAYANTIFWCMKKKDSVSWNIILRAYLDNDSFEPALGLYILARGFGFEPNVSTLVLMLQAICSLTAFEVALAFHGYLMRSGNMSLNSVQNSLLGAYVDFSTSYSKSLFDEITPKDAISWTLMIKCYVKSGDSVLALELFKKMVSEDEVEVDGQMMVSVMKGCTVVRNIGIGKSVHAFVLIRALSYDIFVGNSLLDFYSKCGDVDSAVKAFSEMPETNVVSWNSLLAGFVHNENYTDALAIYSLMEKSGFDVDEVTLVNLLQAFKLLGYLVHCKMIHCRVVRRGFESNDKVINSLIDSYAKCGKIELSWRTFCQLETPDIISWSTMISSFTYNGMPDEAIALYQEMQNYVEKPTQVALLNLLQACALSVEIRRSKWAHGHAVRIGFASDVVVGTAIVDMYSKCGAIDAARSAFDQISEKNVVSWSAMIAAYGFNGLPHAALSLVPEMEAQGIRGNPVTTLSILSACCHGGLVQEGLTIFKEPETSYLKPEHYSCLVDLLARSGNLNDALDLITLTPSPVKSRASAWGALLSASRSYGNQKFTSSAISHVLELEPTSSAGYLLASNSYLAGGAWIDAARMRNMMKERGVAVVVGYSLIHVDDKSVTFSAGDRHPLYQMLSPVIEQLHSSMRISTAA